MKVLHKGLSRTNLASNIQDLFAISFYEAIGLKLRIFPPYVANSLDGVVYEDLF